MCLAKTHVLRAGKVVNDMAGRIDLERIPTILRGLNWGMPQEGAWWEDGTELLVAVSEQWGTEEEWCYEFSMLYIECNGEDLFRLRACGSENWRWDFDDIDLLVVVRGGYKLTREG